MLFLPKILAMFCIPIGRRLLLLLPQGVDSSFEGDYIQWGRHQMFNKKINSHYRV
jgi:hypothetical protein